MMIRDFLNILLHRVPWNGDRIRLYQWLDREDQNRPGYQAQEFIGEYYIKIRYGDVLVLDNTDRRYIRRDLPTWSSRFSCWSYYYSTAGGE